MWGYLKTFFFFSKNGSKKRKLKLDWPIRSEQLTAIFHLIPPPLRIVQRRTKENLLKAFYSRPYVHEKEKKKVLDFMTLLADWASISQL